MRYRPVGDRITDTARAPRRDEPPGNEHGGPGLDRTRAPDPSFRPLGIGPFDPVPSSGGCATLARLEGPTARSRRGPTGTRPAGAARRRGPGRVDGAVRGAPPAGPGVARPCWGATAERPPDRHPEYIGTGAAVPCRPPSERESGNGEPSDCGSRWWRPCRSRGPGPRCCEPCCRAPGARAPERAGHRPRGSAGWSPPT
jgi:hypothetical protein